MHTTTSKNAALAGAFLHNVRGETSPEMQACITNCITCAAVCEQTLRYCLEKGGEHAKAAHIGLLQDCVEICNTSAHFMLRGSDRHAATCRACAEICAACAEACETMGDDEVMKQCAEACRTCAASCRSMAGMAH